MNRFLLALLFLFPDLAYCSSVTSEHVYTLVSLIIIILVARLGVVAANSIKLPAVSGELLAGICLGVLGAYSSWFSSWFSSSILKLHVLSELGLLLLLFQVGAHTNLKSIRALLGVSSMVAIVGVAAPIVLSMYILGPIFIPQENHLSMLFIAASLTATSIAVTARVFKETGILKSKEANIVLGAAVIDDILGIVLLVVVCYLGEGYDINIQSVLTPIVKVIVFFIISGTLISFAASKIGQYVSSFDDSAYMGAILAVGINIITSYIAILFGISPIIGAFIAGILVANTNYLSNFHPRDWLMEIHLAAKALPDSKERREISNLINHRIDQHVLDIVESWCDLFAPIFFVLVGTKVSLHYLFTWHALHLVLGITTIAIISKLLSGAVVSSSRKLVIGWAMVPRGEVGLVFAVQGRNLGVFNEELFAILIIAIVLTTIIGPIFLNREIRRVKLCDY